MKQVATCGAMLAGLAALTAAELLTTHNLGLISHPMWLDESVTRLLLTDPSFRHMLAAIYGGVDTNGPAFYAVAWPVTHLLGIESVAGLRIVTAAAMLLAMTGAFATCSRFVEPGRAAIGTLAIAAHPAVLVQTWQLRMYGFWLAAIAWFCAYTVLAGSRASWPTRLAGCVLAILVVTSHWLGVIALVLISAPAVFRSRSERGRQWNHTLPLGVGLATVALCIPLIASQRRILGVATWIEPATVTTVLAQLRGIYVVPSMGVIVAYAALRVAWRDANKGLGLKDPLLALPVLSLLLYPIALVVMSIVIQPVLVERYMIPTAIGLALVVSLAVLPFRGWPSVACAALAAAGLVVVACLELKGLRAVTQPDDERAARVIAISERTVASGQRVIFARRFEAYPLLQARPSLADSVAILDVSGSVEALGRRTIFERDLGRAVSRYYPTYHLVSEDSLRALSHFVVVTDSDEEDELPRLFPGFRLTKVGVDEYAAAVR